MFEAIVSVVNPSKLVKTARSPGVCVSRVPGDPQLVVFSSPERSKVVQALVSHLSMDAAEADSFVEEI